MPGSMPPQPVSPHPILPRYYARPDAKRSFLRDIFDRTAADYDRIEKLIGLGTGSWYRRQALVRAGLGSGMRVLDVATGTGLVAREAIAIAGSADLVLGVDPSAGMLRRAAESLRIPAALGIGEQLPVRDVAFDFLSMGYALRHVGSLEAAFNEFFRVLRPGGRLCILEITRPDHRFGRFLVRSYLRWIVPAVARLAARERESTKLWTYYWDTIEACVPPHAVIDALRRAGFCDVLHHTELSLFSEYTALKP